MASRSNKDKQASSPRLKKNREPYKASVPPVRRGKAAGLHMSFAHVETAISSVYTKRLYAGVTLRMAVLAQCVAEDLIHRMLVRMNTHRTRATWADFTSALDGSHAQLLGGCARVLPIDLTRPASHTRESMINTIQKRIELLKKRQANDPPANKRKSKKPRKQ